MSITDRLRKEIRDRQSVYVVAKGSGISHPVLLRFAKGERDIRLATAAKLADYFGLELAPKVKPTKGSAKRT
jgi:hypothetical protein